MEQEAEAHNPAVEMEMWAIMEYCNRGTLQSGVDKVRRQGTLFPKPCSLAGALPRRCGHAHIGICCLCCSSVTSAGSPQLFLAITQINRG